jgi:thiol:disulfide interchange protein DsbC
MSLTFKGYNREMKAIFNSLLIVLIVFFQSNAFAQESAELNKEDIAGLFPTVLPTDVFDSPLEGFYEVALGTSIAYVSRDGKYVLQGDLYAIDSLENLTDLRRADVRVIMLNSVDRSKTILYETDGPARYRVMIFTDVDCGYCRQFHRDIEQVLAMGIEVEYFFFPRTGPNTESWSKAESVWCSRDQHAALTQAKTTGNIAEVPCFGSPVADHYNLGQRIGIRGTPAIFNQQGEELGGYLTPEMLLAQLEKSPR